MVTTLQFVLVLAVGCQRVDDSAARDKELAELRKQDDELKGAQQARSADLDLDSGTMFGKKLADLTFDTVTDTFGRPNVVLPTEQDNAGRKQGRRVLYSDRGVIFAFNPMDEDPQEKCVLLIVFLASSTHESGMTFSPFTGTISGGIGKDTKTKQIHTLYSQAFDITAGSEIGSLSGRAKPYKFGQILLLRKNGPNITFDYDKTTKFVERIHVAFGSAPPAALDEKGAIIPYSGPGSDNVPPPALTPRPSPEPEPDYMKRLREWKPARP